MSSSETLSVKSRVLEEIAIHRIEYAKECFERSGLKWPSREEVLARVEQRKRIREISTSLASVATALRQLSEISRATIESIRSLGDALTPAYVDQLRKVRDLAELDELCPDAVEAMIEDELVVMLPGHRLRLTPKGAVALEAREWRDRTVAGALDRFIVAFDEFVSAFARPFRKAWRKIFG